MTYEQKTVLVLLGAAIGFIFSYLLWLLKEEKIAKQKKSNLLRIINADVTSTRDTLQSINSYEMMFSNLKKSDPQPLILFNPTRMGDFFLNFKEDIYLIPPNLTKDILDYYDKISACTLYCDTFKTEDFKAFEFERKQKAYGRWVELLKEADTKGNSLLRLLELNL